MRGSAFIGLLLAFGLGFGLGIWLENRKTPISGEFRTISERVDTCIVRDTIVQYRAFSQKITIRDTIRIKADTVRIADTLFVEVERQQIEWSDSLATVWASGVGVAVDSIKHYTSTRYVTSSQVVEKIRKDSRLGIGISAGYALTPKGGQPYIGIGLNYNLYNFKKKR